MSSFIILHHFLFSFDWPASCKVIPEKCFTYSAITQITGIENVEAIEFEAFSYSNIEEFDMPKLCHEIAGSCFKKTYNLKKVKVNASSIKIFKEAFFGSGIEEIDAENCDEIYVDDSDINYISKHLRISFEALLALVDLKNPQ